MAATPNPNRELFSVLGKWQERLRGEEGMFKVATLPRADVDAWISCSTFNLDLSVHLSFLQWGNSIWVWVIAHGPECCLLKASRLSSAFLLSVDQWWVAGADAAQLGFCRPKLPRRCHKAAGHRGGENFPFFLGKQRIKLSLTYFTFYGTSLIKSLLLNDQSSTIGW